MRRKENQVLEIGYLIQRNRKLGGRVGNGEGGEQGQGGYRKAGGRESLPGGFQGGLIMYGKCWERRKSREEGREEGGQEAEKEMKMFFHLLPGEKGPGCDRENDGKSHWSCWFERICLWNKLFISQP